MKRDEGEDFIERQLRQLETELQQPAVRRDPARLTALLAEEFCEFGSSGRSYTRQETIEALAAESPVRISISDFTATIVSAGVALVRYRAAHTGESGQIDAVSLRSSLWVLREERWQMLFHQGTKVSR